MKSINDLLTPCLILDEDKFSKNIRRIKSLLKKKSIISDLISKLPNVEKSR